ISLLERLFVPERIPSTQRATKAVFCAAFYLAGLGLRLGPRERRPGNEANIRLFLCPSLPVYIGPLSVTQDLFTVGPPLPVPEWSHHAFPRV
ncbi:hypothetical protein GBAR_LOCUS10384, partial [Geodia barretti]